MMYIVMLITCLMIPFSTTVYASIHDKPCDEQCCTPFGTVLGENNKVIAYSNCNNDTESDLWQSITLDNDAQEITTGMKWQCVEYARRWLVTNRHYTFASIDHAYQIWDLPEATQIATGKSAPWLKGANNQTSQKPQQGDLLIYDTSVGMHGHVAVIVAVDDNHVYIGEQNYFNQLWEGNDYARALPLIRAANGMYQIEDEGVIGWMHINEHRPT